MARREIWVPHLPPSSNNMYERRKNPKTKQVVRVLSDEAKAYKRRFVSEVVPRYQHLILEAEEVLEDPNIVMEVDVLVFFESLSPRGGPSPRRTASRSSTPTTAGSSPSTVSRSPSEGSATTVGSSAPRRRSTRAKRASCCASTTRGATSTGSRWCRGGEARATAQAQAHQHDGHLPSRESPEEPSGMHDAAVPRLPQVRTPEVRHVHQAGCPDQGGPLPHHREGAARRDERAPRHEVRHQERLRLPEHEDHEGGLSLLQTIPVLPELRARAQVREGGPWT